MPVVHIRPFCEAVTRASAPQSSKSMRMQPTELTASTIVSIPCAFASEDTALMSMVTAVVDSLWHMVTALACRWAARVASKSAESGILSHSVHTQWAVQAVRAPAISANILANLPLHRATIHVTWRQQIGDDRFHRAAPCSVYRQDWLLCIRGQPYGLC